MPYLVRRGGRLDHPIRKLSEPGGFDLDQIAGIHPRQLEIVNQKSIKVNPMRPRPANRRRETHQDRSTAFELGAPGAFGKAGGWNPQIVGGRIHH